MNRCTDGVWLTANLICWRLNRSPAKRRLWKHDRPNEARMNRRKLYSTPIPFEHAGRTALLISGGDCISGHSLKAAMNSGVGARGTRPALHIGGWSPHRSPAAELFSLAVPKGSGVRLQGRSKRAAG